MFLYTCFPLKLTFCSQAYVCPPYTNPKNMCIQKNYFIFIALYLLCLFCISALPAFSTVQLHINIYMLFILLSILILLTLIFLCLVCYYITPLGLLLPFSLFVSFICNSHAYFFFSSNTARCFLGFAFFAQITFFSICLFLLLFSSSSPSAFLCYLLCSFPFFFFLSYTYIS